MDKETIVDYVMNTPHNANRQVLEGMLDGAGSGTGLPAVSEEDEGKVLTVVNGEWDKAESSAGPLIVRVDHTEGLDTYYDKTWNEVKQALTENRDVVFGGNINEWGGIYYRITRISFNGSKGQVYVDNGQTTAFAASVGRDGSLYSTQSIT